VYKHGSVNPLNVYGLRRLDHIPPHFTPIQFDTRVSDKVLTDWIYENLQGRFFLGPRHFKNQNKSIEQQHVAAFEIAAEASYFGLILDTINQYQTY
jgi:hypothetical protein